MANQNQWGSPTSSRDYEIVMPGATPIARPLSIVGHGITGESDELRDAVTEDFQVLERGLVRTKQRTVVAAERISRTGTVLYPNVGMTPLLNFAEKNNQSCITNLFARRLCAKPGESHFFVYEGMRLNPPSRVNDFIPLDDTTTAAFQSEFTAEDTYRVWEVGAFLANDLGTNLYAVAFTEEDCVDCSETELAGLVAVGGNGAAGSVDIYYSDDRFATIENQQAVGSAGDIGTSVYTEGNIILVGWADNATPGSATAGGTYISGDLMASSPTADNDLSEPIWAVARFRGDYVAVGGTASQGKVWTSVDGVNWKQQTTANLPTAALISLAVDDDNDVFYVGASDGTLIRGQFNGTAIQFSVITTPGTPGSIAAIAVLDDDRFTAAGAASYGIETFNGGVAISTINFPGNSEISALAGTSIRSMVGVGTNLYVRDILTNNQYDQVVPENGVVITGNFTDIAVADNEYFAAVTDDGEILFIKPYHPFA